MSQQAASTTVSPSASTTPPRTEAFRMEQDYHFKVMTKEIEWFLEDMRQVNSAIMGIAKVLDVILDEELDPASTFELRDNGFVKGGLMDGIKTIANFIDIKLEQLSAATGVKTE